MTQIISTIAVNDMVVVRANKIAERTSSLEMGIAKAMLIEQLKAKLSGVAHIIFQKRDGSLREMYCTTNPSLVARHINGRGVTRECYATTAVFDVEKGAWRSFRWEALIKVF
jgi:hypothetical protein